MNIFDAQRFEWLGKQMLTRTLVASMAGAVVETAPSTAALGNIDNVLIPASSIAVMMSI